jgi:hypothetical protein
MPEGYTRRQPQLFEGYETILESRRGGRGVSLFKSEPGKYVAACLGRDNAEVQSSLRPATKKHGERVVLDFSEDPAYRGPTQTISVPSDPSVHSVSLSAHGDKTRMTIELSRGYQAFVHGSEHQKSILIAPRLQFIPTYPHGGRY